MSQPELIEQYRRVLRNMQHQNPFAPLSLLIYEAKKILRVIEIDWGQLEEGSKRCTRCGGATKFNRELCNNCLSEFNT